MLISGFLLPIPDPSPVVPSADKVLALDPAVTLYDTNIIFFYKTWDSYGALSNFSPHPVQMPDEHGNSLTWPSVEHYYQVSAITIFRYNSCYQNFRYIFDCRTFFNT